MLKLNNIKKRYNNDKNDEILALDDVSISFPDKGLVIINGTSGCGKTTLLNILGGLDRPTSGEVYVNGIRVDNENEKWWDDYRGNYVGIIYQDFNLLDNMTVRENIQLPLALLQLDEEVRQNKINEIVNELGVGEYLNKKAGKLSGGQKQRVAIARALVTGAKIILADEPTGNLDRKNSENVFKLLKNISKSRLVIVVTHDFLLAKEYADRLIQIAYGRIEKDLVIETNPIDKKDDMLRVVDTSSSLDTSLISGGRRKLSLRECMGFAVDAMKQRKMRCFVSIMIFSITMLFILLLCETVYRNDSVSMTKYIIEENDKLLPLFVEVQDEYMNLVEDEKITTGRETYNILTQCTDKSRVIRCGGASYVKVGTNNGVYCSNIYVEEENEEYFAFKGKFPEKDNEIAISEKFVKELGSTYDVIGSKVFVNEKEYTITAVITKMCGRDIEDVIMDGGIGSNLYDNIIVYSAKALVDKAGVSHIYMSGFGVVTYSDFFYQMTSYNNICAVDDAITLVAGRMPENDNEILISLSILEQMNCTDKDFVEKVYKLNNTCKSKYGRSYWNMLNLYRIIGEHVTVVGVAQGKGDYYIKTSLYFRILEEFKMYHEKAYYLIVDERTFEDDMYSLIENNVKIKNQHLERVYNFIDSIDSFKNAMIIVVMIIALLAVLQMVSLYSYSINDNKKTIGVLRTVGVNKTDTKKIFTVECLVVSISSLIVSISIAIVLTKIVNGYISENIFGFDGFSFLNIRFNVIAIAGIANCIMSVCSVLVPLRKYSKMKIIELIK